MAPAADILRYILGRPRTQRRVVHVPLEREALRRLRDSGAIMSCQSFVASLFQMASSEDQWADLAQAVRDDLDTDPDRATMGFVAPDQAIIRVMEGAPAELPDPLALLDT